MRRRVAGAPAPGTPADVDGGRGGAPFCARSKGGGAGTAPGHTRGHELHGPRPAGRHRHHAARHLPRPGWRPRAVGRRRRLGRLAAARRDRLGHQFRRFSATHRSALFDSGARWARRDGAPCLPGHAAGKPRRRTAGAGARARRGAVAARRCRPTRARARAHRRHPNRARRYRRRDEPSVATPWPDADRQRRGRLPVHGDEHGPDGARRAGLLRDDGLWCARRPGFAGGNRRAPGRAGGRRRVPDDGVGAG